MNEIISVIITHLTNFVVHVISISGYAGIAMLMAIESAAIPLPSEIIMPFAGYLVSQGRFTLLGISLAGGIGSMVGSAITYGIGRYGGRPLLERYGKYVLISPHDLELADRFFQRFGAASTFIGRLLPVIRTFISIPAGISKVSFTPFLFYSFVGSVVWSAFLGYLGFRLGPAWLTLRERLHWLDTAMIIVVLAGIAWWIHRHFKNRQK